MRNKNINQIIRRRYIFKTVNMLLKVVMMINPFNQWRKIIKYFKKKMKSGKFLNKSINLINYMI